MKKMKSIEAYQVLPEGIIMTLKDIVDLINNKEIKEREVDSKGQLKTRHANAIKKPINLTGESSLGTAPIISAVYNNIGQTVETYALTSKQVMAAGVKLNNAYLMQIVNKVEFLRGERSLHAHNPQLPGS